MAKPTLHEMISQLSEHYGMTKGDVISVLKTPLHPHGLRDEFAGKAMQAFIAMAGDIAASAIPTASYDMADAMLKARNS